MAKKKPDGDVGELVEQTAEPEIVQVVEQIHMDHGRPDFTKPFREALNIAVRRVILTGPNSGRRRLDVIAERLTYAAMSGNILAIREIADRLDGKPAQQIHTIDREGNPAPTGIVITFVEPEPEGDQSDAAVA